MEEQSLLSWEIISFNSRIQYMVLINFFTDYKIFRLMFDMTYYSFTFRYSWYKQAIRVQKLSSPKTVYNSDKSADTLSINSCLEGPIPITVVVPGGSCVSPASLIIAYGKSNFLAFSANSCNSS